MEDNVFDPKLFLERLRSGKFSGRLGEEFRRLTEEQLEAVVRLMASNLDDDGKEP
jgi:hypothetical protein